MTIETQMSYLLWGAPSHDSSVHSLWLLHLDSKASHKDFKRSSEILCRAAIECVVKERFGAKAFRVFRLLLLKKMLEQKQVADFAMIPSKEAKEILYTLLAEKFVSLQVI